MSSGGKRAYGMTLNQENQRTAERFGLIQLVLWSKPTEIIDSIYGNVSMEEYCEMEGKRIAEGGDGRITSVFRQDGFVSLWVNDVGEYN